MGSWVVTVAGIAILSVLCDVILPDGQTRKYIKTVFGVIVSLVIIQPVVALFSHDVVGGVVESETIEPQQQYIESVVNRQNQYALDSVVMLLKTKEITVKNIELDSSRERLVLEIANDFSPDLNVVVNKVASAYFPNLEIVCIWSKG